MRTPTAARRRTPWTAAPLLCAVLLTGCTGGAAQTPGTEPTPTPTATSAELSVEAAPDVPAGDGGPVDSFRTWLAASRTPDVETACGYMTPELAQSMVDEITAQGFPGITDCASLIEMTAGLYAAVGQSAETVVELREQTDEQAVLHVVYVEGSSCGRIVLAPADGRWVLTERSTEEC
ncbi:hypothetical protein [Cellulomonas wangsupingiae]|uniref:Lipoprotein n=1 Tax=Cellulomonas wangsupingiae TaxID=2968085 RepID=A0ABY5K704_9CELL|nr:hypothetical protein [Cellulomonas wangsupingiae]MCC2334819.1 hypothetical protein [Cellulomonas wangsupingiae]UUI66229.1 hypothetical protein NP075_05800 [Cellulomonas wangsupingiae]